MSTTEDVKEVVKQKYGQAALRVTTGGSSCCGAAAACGTDVDPITSNLYDEAQKSGLPQEAVLASLGCGNPTALEALNPGEVVLDLGSGGGIDVLLSAKRVGPNGKAYGLDMTDEMLALARENLKKSGLTNVEFWGGCVAGALEESSYRNKLAGAGFENIDVEPTRIYRAADAKHFVEDA